MLRGRDVLCLPVLLRLRAYISESVLATVSEVGIHSILFPSLVRTDFHSLKMSLIRRASTLSAAFEHAFPLAGLFDQAKPQSVSQPRTLKAVLMRAGTSKGMFVHRKDLPSQRDRWARVLSTAMGSGNSDTRQLDGIGGASSTTSKAAIIDRSMRSDADIDYTFAQVSVGQDKVDFRGSCGNIASGVAAFAVEEGIVQPAPGQNQVSRLCNIQGSNADQSRHLSGCTTQILAASSIRLYKLTSMVDIRPMAFTRFLAMLEQALLCRWLGRTQWELVAPKD